MIHREKVLRLGGVFAGIDSRYSFTFGVLHWFDTMVVVDPNTMYISASGN